MRTPEQKSEILHKHLNAHISVQTPEREYTVEGGFAFISKGHPGNSFAALHTGKKLSEPEKLRLVVAKAVFEVNG